VVFFIKQATSPDIRLQRDQPERRIHASDRTVKTKDPEDGPLILKDLTPDSFWLPSPEFFNAETPRRGGRSAARREKPI
jgi:hypothetical protein